MPKKLRIFLLRLLVGWWFVPIIIFFGSPILYLTTGSKNEVKEFTKFIIKLAWKGTDSNS